MLSEDLGMDKVPEEVIPTKERPPHRRHPQAFCSCCYSTDLGSSQLQKAGRSQRARDNEEATGTELIVLTCAGQQQSSMPEGRGCSAEIPT